VKKRIFPNRMDIADKFTSSSLLKNNEKLIHAGNELQNNSKFIYIYISYI
jgi:hypothetical protein